MELLFFINIYLIINIIRYIWYTNKKNFALMIKLAWINIIISVPCMGVYVCDVTSHTYGFKITDKLYDKPALFFVQLFWLFMVSVLKVYNLIN